MKKLFSKLTNKLFKKPIPRRFYFEEDMCETILAMATYPKGDRISKYRLWKKIEGIFPETKEGLWGLYTKSATQPYVEEVLKR